MMGHDEKASYDTGDELRAEVHHRIQRFAQLRSVRRVLAPSVRELQQDAMADLGRTLREALERLSSQAASIDVPNEGDRFLFASSMETIDRELSETARELLAHADGVDPPQLRATLPRVQERHPTDVVALLDLILENRDGIQSRMHVIEYLVTLLATEERSGRRVICRDPVTISGTLRSLAAERELHSTAETQDFELELYQASGLDPSDASSSEIVTRMRSRKQELGIDCLRPSTLRAIVTYNTRMFNRMFDDLEAARRSDADLAALSAMQAPAIDDDLGRDQWAEQLEEEEKTSAPMHESEGLRLISEALQRRLKGQAIGSCTSERVALALDISCLAPEDADALSHGLEEQGPEALMGKTILVGLLLKDSAALPSELSELDIARNQLDFDWVQELDTSLSSTISQLLSDNAYDLACRLSEAKTRFLYAPLSSLRRSQAHAAQLRRRGHDGEALASEPEQKHASAQAVEWTGVTGFTWAVHGRLVAMALTLCLLIVGTMAMWPEAEIPDLHRLSVTELDDVSDYIRSAYRDGQGNGDRLVGQLDRDWLNLSEQERTAAAESMSERADELGIRDLMLYDDRHDLQVHYTEGQLRTLVRIREI